MIWAFEYGYGLPFQDILCEEEVSHVGPAPGPIHGEEPKPSYGKAVYVVVGMGYLLTGLFGGSVQAGGPVSLVLFGKRDFVVEPIDRAGRGPHNRGLWIGRFAGLENIHEARDVAGDIGRGIFHRVTDPGLGRKVHHVREGHEVEKLDKQIGVVYVTVDHEDPVPKKKVLAGPFQGRVVVIVEIVEPDYAVAAPSKGGRDVAADEAGGASDEDREVARPGGV
ncbi:root hair defective 3 GTP-binding protein [Striga asiatica]|uniref:Root hair defective 3 GTP-binding protein n=1 Tax=Striga asiatica TaxID=4170 RepID=A0A5A7PRX9_STRAF|nr:root hair defective 3 GTP-binding protein [Striga asiatica]